MENAPSWLRAPSAAEWREVIWPKEHGSWSLAFEPVAFGLLAAPSVGGASLAAAVTVAFFARRPLRIAWRDARSERAGAARVALGACAAGACLALGGAMAAGGSGWLVWLLPSVLGGAVFVGFDLHGDGRVVAAEVAGAAAFAAVPAAMAVLAGWPPWVALALAIIMAGRAVPTVLCVRAALRHARTGEVRRAPSLIAAGTALAAGIGLVFAGVAPPIAACALTVLAARTIALLVYPRPVLRARALGMIEAMLGIAFVLIVALSWRP